MLKSVTLARSPSVHVARVGHVPEVVHVDPEEEIAEGLSVSVVESGTFEMESVGASASR